jgi:Tfp pilus assembly protein PilN
LLEAVSSGAWLEIDLLRQRRQRYGTERPAVIPVRTLLLRGALFGSALPLILLLTCVWLWISESRLRQRAAALQPLADEHDLLEVKLQKEKRVLEDAVQINQAMARAMADVRSSSVLLGVLQRLVPQSISLEQAKIDGDALDLKGEVLMPDGLRKLNALMLSLGQSPLFEEDGVTLQQARLQPSASPESADPGRLSYSLSMRFASDAPQAIRPYLSSLGAIGLERRLQRLQQEEGLFE